MLHTGKRRGLRVSTAHLTWIACLLGAALMPAQTPLYGPLTRSNFTQVIGPNGLLPQGFGDRQNSWAWSMAWFRGKLVVGTARSYDCMVQASLNRSLFGLIPYPPLDKDELCTPDYHDLGLRAEIWTWTPETNTWAMVFQAPQDITNPDVATKKLSDDVGYRYMLVYTEPGGGDALYISGLGPRFIYGSTVPNGRLLRTADLINFQPVPAAAGTVLGNLNNSGWRGITSYNGRFFGIAGTIEGNGVVVESSNPQLGNNSFKVITRPGDVCSELLPYNGYLYLSLSNNLGFRVVKTNAIENSPGAGYTFTEVIPFGGGRTDFPNQDVWSMKVFNNRLYIGGNGVQSFLGAEMYRINPDDTWDLLSGETRTLNGVVRTPLSGLGSGFGWGLNAHMWRQEVFDGRLYVGTFDASTIFKDIPIINTLLTSNFGADLFYTDDGVYFYPVDQQGFQDKFNFGFRTLLNTVYGMFVGTANYYYGLQVFRGQPTGSAAAATSYTPKRLDGEYSSGRFLLSWDQPPAGGKFHVMRSTSVATNALASKGATSPTLVPGPWQLVGTTDKPYFADLNVSPTGVYSYKVTNGLAASDSLATSNLTALPNGSQPVTLRAVTDWIQNCQKRGCFTSNVTYTFMLSQYAKAAQAAVTKGDLTPLVQLDLIVKTNYQQGATIMTPTSAQDLELQLVRLAKRFTLYQAGYLKLADL